MVKLVSLESGVFSYFEITVFILINALPFLRKWCTVHVRIQRRGVQGSKITKLYGLLVILIRIF